MPKPQTLSQAIALLLSKCLKTLLVQRPVRLWLYLPSLGGSLPNMQTVQKMYQPPPPLTAHATRTGAAEKGATSGGK